MSPAKRPKAEISDELAAAIAGRFIVFDGPDGSGKSTQLAKVTAALDRAGVGYELVREPGGTSVGERIRAVILEKDDEPATPVCEMLLFMASRNQLIDRTVRPALEKGRAVLTDRFTSSTLAYQGSAGGVPAEDILRVASVACDGVGPDLTIIFDVSVDVSSLRLHGARKANDEPKLFEDGMESRGRAFFEKVRKGYLDQVDRDRVSGEEKYALIDASSDEHTVFAELVRVLESKFLSQAAEAKP